MPSNPETIMHDIQMEFDSLIDFVAGFSGYKVFGSSVPKPWRSSGTSTAAVGIGPLTCESEVAVRGASRQPPGTRLSTS